MSLHLDARQRAMLQEMGVQVWLPAPPASNVTRYHHTDDTTTTPPRVVASTPPLAATAPPSRTTIAPATPAPTTVPTTSANILSSSDSHMLPQLSPPQPLYATANAASGGPTWLIVAENQPGTNPLLADEAGTLLNNMLQALRLHQAPQQVFFCGVALSSSGFVHALQTPTQTVLSGYLAQIQPTIVLLMGRLAARTILDCNEPLGQLRALPHQIGPYPAIVTYEASYLLRHGKYKAAAWADLCRAHALVQTAQPH